eukprot:5528710-Amphidinium_carterae.1
MLVGVRFDGPVMDYLEEFNLLEYIHPRAIGLFCCRFFTTKVIAAISFCDLVLTGIHVTENAPKVDPPTAREASQQGDVDLLHLHAGRIDSQPG